MRIAFAVASNCRPVASLLYAANEINQGGPRAWNEPEKCTFHAAFEG